MWMRSHSLQMNVSFQNITVMDTAEGVGFQLGGDQVFAKDLYAKNTGSYAYSMVSAQNFSGSHLVACNADSQSVDISAVIMTSSNPVTLDNVTLMDNRASQKTRIEDSYPNNHTVTNVVQLTTATAANSSSPDVTFCFTPGQTPVTFVSAVSSSARVYPNPFRSTRGDQTMTFDQMPSGSTVKIFTVSARRVTTPSAPTGKVPGSSPTTRATKWASGLYLYTITDSQGNETRGKLAILK